MIALGSDHGGFDLKQRVKAYLDEKHIPYKDYGCDSKESCDYPIFGKASRRGGGLWGMREGHCHLHHRHRHLHRRQQGEGHPRALCGDPCRQR